MPKQKISEFNSNPALNTDIDSINLAEGCAPSGINDAIRELMSQLKDWQSGTSNDPYVVGSSGSLTLNQGTANGVAYLNGSKVVTSGSALTFDGTNLGVGGTASQRLHVQNAGTLMGLLQNTASTADARYRIQNTGGSSDWGVDGTGTYFQDNNSRPFLWFTAGSEQMRLTSTGLVVGGTAATNTSSGRGNITINGSSSAILSMGTGGTAKGYVYHSGSDMIVNATTGTLALQANGNGALIDSSGNLGLGVTPSAWTTVTPVFQINRAALYGYGNEVSLSANYLFSSGDKYIASDFATRYNQANGQHRFYTAPSGTAGNAITFTQALTLDANGNLLVGKTASAATSVGFQVGQLGEVYTTKSTSTNADATYYLYSTGAGAYRFYVGLGGTISATSTTITGISDQRLKENIRDLDDGLEKVMALQPRKFDWKEGKGADTKNARGFIAQEFETVFPDMVEEWLDPAPEGEEPYKAVNANLIPTLVKAIQEQQAIIESLKARLDAANL